MNNDEHVVVCVDDEPAVLASLRRVLRGQPYELLTTADPKEALNWVGRQRVDVLVTDQRMPAMSGVELMQEVRQRSPSTACLMLTAYPSSGLAIDAMRAGGDWLISKPWQDGELRETIGQLLTSGHRTRREPVVRIDCRGRPGLTVLDELEPHLKGGELTVILRNLAALEGSLYMFFEGLAERVRDAGARLTLVDDSGGALVVLSALGWPAPITVIEEPPSDGSAGGSDDTAGAAGA